MSSAIRRDSSGQSNATTLSEGIVRALESTTLHARAATTSFEGSEEHTDQVLKRTLSTRSVISTTSSLASRMQRAASDSTAERQDLRVIGLGSCGSVFEVPGTEIAFKKGTSEQGIWQDFCLTNSVHNAVNQVQGLMQETFPDSTIIRTSLCHEYHTADSTDFWICNLQRFPAGHRTKQPLFAVDRILPLPQATREALIKKYFDDDNGAQQEAKDDQDNKDCLVRIYLGERESRI
ncbi:hypothetical protein MMC12_003372 [Toensbergia leucococca]|nr:hypothetical protein [Toensbergia leucococca]